jgi:hypothetical protein
VNIQQLISELSKLDPDTEVFLECADTGGSWSIDKIHVVKGEVILGVKFFDGPTTPDPQ